MKIAILTCGILPIPAVQGGAVENLIDYYLEYNNQNKLYDITIYSPWDNKVKKHLALTSDVNHYRYINVTSLKARISRWIYRCFHSNEYYNHFIEYYFERVYSSLKRINYDIILLENCPGYAYKLTLRGHHNLVLHLHNELLHSSSRHHNIIFNSCLKILTVSDYIKERVSTIQTSCKIQTIHNGIDLKMFSPTQNNTNYCKEIGFSDNDFIIVYSGRINKEKGVNELVDAMLKLQNYPNIKLMIMGGSFFGNTSNEDEFTLQLKKKAEDLRERILFTGFIPYEKIPEYLQIADIAIIPSIWNDPFPTTVLEAQAMGLPIITTRRGGIPEEVSEKNAILLETDEDFIKNLALAIINLYKHPEKRKQMAKISLEHSKQFDKTLFARSFLKALSSK